MVEQRIRNAQVVGSSPIPSSIADRFVMPFGRQGGFLFLLTGFSECAISAPLSKKVRLFHRCGEVSAFLCVAFLEKIFEAVHRFSVRLLYKVKILVCCGEVCVSEPLLHGFQISAVV